MAKMKAVQVPKPGADFEIVEREIPNPTAGHVRIRVQACGICHSDLLVKEGIWPGIQYPRVPGHEVAGVIDEIGSGVVGWKKGQRVGVGWHGGQDGTCIACRRGDFVNCLHLKISGISYVPASILSGPSLCLPNQINPFFIKRHMMQHMTGNFSTL